MIDTLSPEIIHTPPHVVTLKNVEDELTALRKADAAGVGANAPMLRACTLTLVVLCDKNEEPLDLEPLIAQIVYSNPARVILIAQVQPEGDAALETRASAYLTGGTNRRLVGEQIAFFPRGGQYGALPSAVLSLRVSGLPLVLYWRGQPDLDDHLFHALVDECDQIIFDSQHFTGRAERINNTIARLRRDYPQISFGDVNWQRIRPWREFVAQFFDDPANLVYLNTIRHVEIQFSVGLGGNQSASVLFMAWLASSLGWDVVHGSYHREGHSRIARFSKQADGGNSDNQIEVVINVREQPDCQPGELTGVRLDADGDPPAVFELKRAVGGFVDIKQTAGSKIMERCATLVIPEESNVIASELDAPRQDRNYHRALEILDALVAPTL
ncbi:MAG TPA: glucose-6-phosphate dehydrogenase assembly protein OpcA [Anaerolineae bacterium]|nr:glucose-6-phosphate dehydrogenase assembly protein OpcA [Anaerolineae bacterium]